MEAEEATATAWANEPGAAVALALLAVLYIMGRFRSVRSGGRSGRTRSVAFGLGWLMLFVALVSPLHPLGERLVSAHMAQHTLLILAPLALVAARTGTRLLQALAPTWRGRLAGRLKHWRPGRSSSAVSLVLLVSTILVWHLPAVFQLAVEIPLLHSVEHVSLVGASAVYWAHVVGSGAVRPERVGPALASVFVLFLAGSVTGAFLTFSTVPWYRSYAAGAASGGTDWLVDQQLAGVLMSVPMGIVLMGVAAWLAWRWSGSVGLRAADTSGVARSVSAATAPNRGPGSRWSSRTRTGP